MNRNIYKKDILYCLCLCEKEIEERKKGIQGESNLTQLEQIIIPELKQLMKIIDEGKLPPQTERYLLSFANAFTVWGWDMKNPTDLFLQLTKLNNNYKYI